MEENQPKIGKFSWTYGLLLGVISVVFAVMLFTMDMHYEQGWDIRSVSLILMISVVILAITKYRKANFGFLKIVDGLKLGAGIGLVSALLGLIWYALLINVIEPDFMDKTMEIAKVKAMAENPKITEAQWAQGAEIQKKFSWLAYPFVIIINITLGLIIGLIGGLILKKQKPEY